MDGKVDDENQRGVNDGDWICPDSQYVVIPLTIYILGPSSCFSYVFSLNQARVRCN